MITTKYFSSSITSSFASVFLVSSLFALCCFSFLYLYPQQDQDHDPPPIIHDINLKFIHSPSSPPSNPKFDNEKLNHGGLIIKENVVVVNNITTSPPPPPPPSPPPLAVKEVLNSTYIPLVNFEDAPLVNASKEERIAWFKARVSNMKIFESTKKSRLFDKRIHDFIPGCEVRFFMVWISSSSLFGARELLSLETVLRAHPNGCMVIVSKTMDSKSGRDLLKPLLKMNYKILIVDPDLSLLFNNTPASHWLEGVKAGEFDPGVIPITQNLSSLLRLVLLYKYGGIYLDTDVIILKGISGFRNSVAIQSVYGNARLFNSVSNAVLIFDQNHPLLLEFIEEFTTNFNGNEWGHNGHELLTRVVSKFTYTKGYDFNILSPTTFFTVAKTQLPKCFRRPKNKNESHWIHDEESTLRRGSYAIHLWKHISDKFKIEEQSLIGKLFKEHCIICKDIYDIDTTSF